MGTSSTRHGKNSKTISQLTNEEITNVTWKSVKTAATKFFKGELGFGGVVQKAVVASGGATHFSKGSAIKKSTALGTLFVFITKAKQVGVKAALQEEGRHVDETKTVKELLLEYTSEVIYPDSVTVEDVANREDFLYITIQFSDLFDESGYKLVEDDLSVEISFKVLEEFLVSTIVKDVELEVPFSIENDSNEIVERQRNIAKTSVRKKVSKYMASYSKELLLRDDLIAENYAHIRELVLTDYENGDYDD